MREEQGSSERTGSVNGSLVYLALSLVAEVMQLILWTLLTLAALAVLVPVLTGCFLFYGFRSIATTIRWARNSSCESMASVKTRLSNSRTNTTDAGSNTEMVWPFKQIELVGGPFDGHVMQLVGRDVPEQLLLPLAPPAEFQRMGRYLRSGDEYVWDGEYIVRDVNMHESIS